MEGRKVPYCGCGLFYEENQAGKEKAVLSFRLIVNDKLSGSVKKKLLYIS